MYDHDLLLFYAREHQRDIRAEVAALRLANQVRAAGSQPSVRRYRILLAGIGQQLVVWGEHLQERSRVQAAPRPLGECC